ncbi:MAG: YoaK family protein [Bacillota bacterium]|nr:YoaK family protein [Bacillota bacterium]
MRQHATPVSESVPFCMLLAIVGGFLDAYTFVGRGGVFCNAQTGNIVLLGIYVSTGKWQLALSHIPPILSFIIGVFLSEMIKANKSAVHYLDWKRIILIFETIVLFIIGFIPSSAPNVIVTATVSLVASIQVSSFRKLVDSQFNTTMSTGNLRSASQALCLAITQKDTDAAVRSIRYFIIILAFLSGALIGGIITSLFGIKAIWSTIVLLIYAVVLIDIEEHKENDIHNNNFRR